MRPDQRVVTRMPLDALWDSHGELRLEKKRAVGLVQVADLLRHGRVRFVLANCGDPLKWVPEEAIYRFWSEDVKARLVEPGEAENSFRLEDYPDEYCYLATEWGGEGEVPVVLLEMYH